MKMQTKKILSIREDTLKGISKNETRFVITSGIEDSMIIELYEKIAPMIATERNTNIREATILKCMIIETKVSSDVMSYLDRW